MKKLVILVGILLTYPASFIFSQQTQPVLTHEMSAEEALRKHEIGRDFTPTNPPSPPVRMVAEFEEMQGVLIRYPFGIPMTLIKEMAEDCKVKTIVASSAEQQTVLNQYISAGVNTSNCEWLIAPTNSYWTRDYGPWFVVDGGNDVGISDFPYNRPRPFDDNIPVVLAGDLDLPLYGMDLIQTGGNWMCDGLGIAASTELVVEENPGMSEQEIDTTVWDYLGIRSYHVVSDPLDDYIKHIDCWGKFLDVDKILIGQVPVSDYRYADYEFVANYFGFQNTSWGNKFQVYRVYTPGTYPNTPYTNSLILNKKVFVPLTGSQWDDEALAVYEEAMPGYEVIGVYHTGWENTDALHCRTKGIADAGMLFIRHMPLLGAKDFMMKWDLTAEIIPYSGMGVISDSLLCYYKVDSGEYQTVPLEHLSGYQYSATIPFVEPGHEVSYYLRAADISGRRKNHPYIGAPDPHVFSVDFAEDAVLSIDSLIFLTEIDAIEGLTFNLCNYTGEDLVINEIEYEQMDLPFPWYIDPWSVELPYTMAPNEVLPLNVKVAMIVNGALGELVVDTLDIYSESGHHKVVLKVDIDLINGIGEVASPMQALIESINPNPFTSSTRITFSLEQAATVRLSVYDLQGRLISMLAKQLFSEGSHEITWGGKDNSGNKVTPGIYLLKLESEKGTDIRKLILTN